MVFAQFRTHYLVHEGQGVIASHRKLQDLLPICFSPFVCRFKRKTRVQAVLIEMFVDSFIDSNRLSDSLVDDIEMS